MRFSFFQTSHAFRINPDAAKRRLGVTICVFIITLAVPLALLFSTFYSKIYTEAFQQQRFSAQLLTQRIDERLIDIVALEEKRQPQEYASANLAGNSPVPALIAYFNISSSGDFTSTKPPMRNDEFTHGTLKQLAGKAGILDKINHSTGWQRTGASKTGKSNTKGAKSNFGGLNTSQLKALNIDAAKQQTKSPSKTYKSKIYSQKKQALESTRKERSLQNAIISQRDIPNQLPGFSLGDSDRIAPEPLAISPLYAKLFQREYLFFWREIWRPTGKSVQGFVCPAQEVIEATIGSAFSGSDLAGNASLVVSSEGMLLQRFNPIEAVGRGLSLSRSAYSPDSSRQQQLLYSSTLTSPFEAIDVLVSVTELPVSSLYYLFALLIFTGIVLVLGSWLLYSLAMKQTVLAAERSNFVSAVSHELRTPLTSIRMYAEMLQAGIVSSEEKKQDYYDFILCESERLSRLIENVLHLSALGKDETTSSVIEISPQNLMNILQERTSAQLKATKFFANFEITGSQTKTLKIDEDSLVQIVINLVDNALKFAKDAERKELQVILSNSDDDGYVTLSVRDFGPGIPDSQLRNIFRLFYRVENELTRSTTGTGIGLALADELARAMGASLDVVNKTPGAEFRIKLPGNPKF